ncbi:SCP2 domain-containing protein [Chitinibacter sp. GC72]|uniref:ubiquinone biosynthesis accessory factor UbiJ n=1 Tax=Chitinibacter sp. GC72 TaxID=1526917 RepID=UPI0012F7F8D7|nr:sterol-binding protein [Chitinibacter sp. GC72]
MALGQASLSALLNHLLGQAPAAQADLSRLAGRTFAVKLPLLAANVVVMPNGLLAHSEGLPEASLSLPLQFFTLRLTDPQAASRQVVLAGDPELASKAGAALGALSWDVAEDLSRLVGDIAAHRIVTSSQQLANAPVTMGRRLTETLVEYLRDEDRMLPRKEVVAAFCDEVDTLRNDLARLDKRLARLEADLGRFESGK